MEEQKQNLDRVVMVEVADRHQVAWVEVEVRRWKVAKAEGEGAQTLLEH